MKHLICTLLISSSLILSAQTTEPKPNIIFIVVDDLNDWVAGYNGHPQAITPTIKKIEKSGTIFVNAECTSPVCGPSRTTLLSGKDAYYTQDYTNSKCVAFRSKFTEAKGNSTLFTLPEFLKDSVGYYTYNIGKIFDCHSNNVTYYDYDDVTSDNCARSLSWSEYYAPDGSESSVVRSYADPLNAGISEFSTCAIPNDMEDDMHDYMNADKAITFINGVSDGTKDICDKPFALFLGIRKPHTPWYIPEKYFLPYYDAEYTTDDYDFNYNTNPGSPYNGVVMPPQPSVRWEDYYSLPSTGLAKWIADIANCEDSIINKMNMLAAEGAFGAMSSDSVYIAKMQESLRGNMIMAYLAGIKFMDAQIGRVFSTLKSHPEIYDNTILVLVSDNGFNHGEKRHWSKAALWEGSERVPFIIADLRNPLKKRVTRQVSLLDVYPTILSMIDAPVPVFPDGTPYLDGHDLTSLMMHPGMAWTSPALMTYKSIKGSQLSCFPQYAVKDNNYKYIRYQSNNSGSLTSCNESHSYFEEELYNIGENRTIDPNEWNNLISDPAYTPEKEYLQQFLPGNPMYLMRAVPVENEIAGYPCLFTANDRLHMKANAYDENGSATDILPQHCIYRWFTSGQAETIDANQDLDMPLDRLYSYADLHNGKFNVYLQVFDTMYHTVKGFNMFDFYTNAAPEPQLDFTVSSEKNGAISITDISYNTSVKSLIWDYGDGNIYEGFTPPAHFYAPGKHTIMATAFYGNTDCEKVFSRDINIPRSAQTEFELYAYPDPASVSSKIFFPVELDKPLVQIFDVKGNLMRSYTDENATGSFTLEVQVSDLPAGMYTIKTQNASAFYSCRLVVVR